MLPYPDGRSDSEGNDWTPLYLSCIAGASTCIGAAIVFCQPRTKSSNKRLVPPGMMAFSLSLAGSVMITVSVISILPECLMDTSVQEGDPYKMIPFLSVEMLWRTLFFALGSALYFGLSWYFVVPEPEEILNSHIHDVLGNNKDIEIEEKENLLRAAIAWEPLDCDNDSYDEESSGDGSTDKLRIRKREQVESSPASPSNVMKGSYSSCGKNRNDKHCGNKESTYTMSAWTSGKDLETKDQRKAWRVAMLLFVSLLFHNFPEGLAVAASALESEKLGITVTIGIMIHNVPEGIAIAIPCLAARPDQPWLSFALASISGLAEPMGAFAALLFLRGLEISDQNVRVEPLVFNLENVLAFVAGIMVMVALWELFPEARRHTFKTWKYFWYGTVCGIVVMVFTELYLP